MTEKRTSRMVAPSFPGTCMSEYIASAMVRVSPSILPAKVIVAPNSPRQRAKPKTNPLVIPGKANGKVILKKVINGDTPRVREVSSIRGSIISTAVRIDRVTRGKETISI